MVLVYGPIQITDNLVGKTVENGSSAPAPCTHMGDLKEQPEVSLQTSPFLIVVVELFKE